LTAEGHPRAIFNRAIERGNLPVAEVTAQEMGKITLAAALELTALIAFKAPRRHGRAAARWSRLYLEANEGAGLNDVVIDNHLSRASEIFNGDRSEDTDADIEHLLPLLRSARFEVIDGKSPSGYRFTPEGIRRQRALGVV
jgi:hypothetical protein